MRITNLRRDRLLSASSAVTRRTVADIGLEAFAAADDATDATTGDATAVTDAGLHDPTLEPRDEAIFLLLAIAEVEHALMVQYLFAAYSLRDRGQTAEHAALVKTWRELLLQIAREEMAHLATVQNLLLVLGAPVHLDREHSPLASQLYPFRFKLQPLTLRSLAKYVTAERPREKPADFPQDEWDFVTGELESQARIDNDGYPLQQVGGLFARLRQLFEIIPGDQFRLDSHAFQARFDDWGYDPENSNVGERLIVDSFAQTTPEELRAATLEAIDAIAIQGEGFDVDPAAPANPAAPRGESHFERFYQMLYKGLRDSLQAEAWDPAWPLATNPNTTIAPTDKPKHGDMAEMVARSLNESGRITHARSRAWAQLFNLRYRLLLNCLSHFLQNDEAAYVTTPGATRGDRTTRGWLLIWTFNEMRRLKKIAGKLVQLPLTDAADRTLHAGPTFELPYTTLLPAREVDRWRGHADVFQAAQRITAQLRQSAPDSNDPFLARLAELDQASYELAQRLARGEGLPPAPEKFQKFVLILEEAVRGFSIGGRHKNFWQGKRWGELIGVNLPTPLGTIINPVTDPTNPRNARIVTKIAATTGWMPLKRPQIPAERIEAIVDWIAAGCRDNEPANMVAWPPEGEPLDEPDPSPPPPQTNLGFATDILPLFRPMDRASMLFLFDLHRYEDVRDHADEILAAVRSGGMPCDIAWPDERIQRFASWIDQGKNP